MPDAPGHGAGSPAPAQPEQPAGGRRRRVRADRSGARRLARLRRCGHEPQGLRRQALRDSVRDVGQPPEPAATSWRGRLQGAAPELGGALEAGGGGPAAAEALRHGIPLSNVGDGNLTTAMLQSWGGRIADRARQAVRPRQPATRPSSSGSPRPPPDSSARRHDLGRRRGQHGLPVGSGGLHRQPRGRLPLPEEERSRAGEGSKYSAAPRARAARGAAGTRTCGPSATGKNKQLAKDLLVYLADDKFMAEYYTYAIYGPVLNSQKTAGCSGKPAAPACSISR